MFCRQCGTQVQAVDRFCSKCGTSTASVEKNMESACPPAVPLESQQIPVFGKPVARGWGPFKAKHPFPENYEWLGLKSTFILFKEHVIVINADESRNRAVDILEAMGLVGGVIAGVRASLDVLANKNFDLSPEAACQLFDKHQLVWCDRSSTEMWSYERKPVMFLKDPPAQQLFCKFHTSIGRVNCFLVISSADYITADYQKAHQAQFQTSWGGIPLDKMFKTVVIKSGVSQKEMIEVMENSRNSATE
jgi:hypothetical protein